MTFQELEVGNIFSDVIGQDFMKVEPVWEIPGKSDGLFNAVYLHKEHAGKMFFIPKDTEVYNVLMEKDHQRNSVTIEGNQAGSHCFIGDEVKIFEMFLNTY